jgi:hypothetical protein
MGDYTQRSSPAELYDDAVLSHKYTWPKHSTVTENQLPTPAMSNTVAALEAANYEDDSNSPEEEKRTKTGGRQKGTPNKMTRVDIMKSARIYSLQALGTLVDIMQDPDQPGAVRVSAANSVLDRAHGKAKQITEIGGIDGGDIAAKLTIEFVGVPPQVAPQVAPQAQITDNPQVVDVAARVIPQQATRPWEVS